MSHACCTFIKPNNEPCAARSLPDSDFCLFHDPAHQDALATGRSKGGAAPRHRVRRFPRLLDHRHVAELLSELFVEALNDPEPIDTQRLQALTRLAQVILKAVGIPKDAEPLQADHREPTAAEDCLLRLYPPVAPELEALLAADPASSISDQEEQTPPDGSDSQQPPAIRSTPHPSNPPVPSPLNARTPADLNSRTPEHLTLEQAGNRSRTGSAATHSPSGLTPVASTITIACTPVENSPDLLAHAPYPLSFQLPLAAISIAPADRFPLPTATHSRAAPRAPSQSAS